MSSREEKESVIDEMLTLISQLDDVTNWQRLSDILHDDFSISTEHGADKDDPLNKLEFMDYLKRVETGNRSSFRNRQLKFIIDGEEVATFLTTDVYHGDQLIAANYSVWGYYRFEDGRLIEFAKIQDILKWMMASNIDNLKRIVDEEISKGNRNAIREYIENLMASGILDDPEKR